MRTQDWSTKRRGRSAPPLKIFCPKCKSHVTTLDGSVNLSRDQSDAERKEAKCGSCGEKVVFWCKNNE